MKAVVETISKDKDNAAQIVKSQVTLIKKTPREVLLKMLADMIFARRFEEKCAEVYRMGKIGGFCHLYIGQEACGIGSISTLRPEDMVIGSYRTHVQAILKGIPPEEILAELFGKSGGCVKGKGGSMHMFSKEHQFYGGHGIVGGQIGVATGMAFSAKYKETDNVVLCYFGEAALNQGIFHESLNMAQLWKLPCIYICENNVYGMGTSQKRAMSAGILEKGEAYGMASESVDGMDVMAVREAVGKAVDRARKDGSPTLIEVKTYRYMGHSMSDPGNYRTREEIARYQERDAIKVFERSLIEAKVIEESDIEKFEQDADARVEHCVEFAENSPFPDDSELLTDIFAA